MLHVSNLTKRYGARAALEELSFTLGSGCVVGLLGPNGAGKSTLFQVLTGLFAPDAGEVEIAGVNLRLHTAQALGHLGVVFQQMSLDLDLTVERNLKFHAELHGMPSSVARQRIADGTVGLGLQGELARVVRELSGGNRRKVELVRALMHRPDVLLLDEPTVGLDPKSRHDLLAAIRANVAEHGTTVLWATHLVAEVEAADRVLVLHRGRLLADGTPGQVTAALGHTSLEAGFIAHTR